MAILIHWSGVLRTSDWGRLILLSASVTAGFIISVEWLTNNRFEAKATELLKSDPSLGDIQKFFGKDRFLVATLGGSEVIGCAGLYAQGGTGTVMHWHVKSQYRNRGLGWDLLDMVIANAKNAKKNAIQRVECETYSLQSRAEKTLRVHGFISTGQQVREDGPIGWFGVGRRTWAKNL